MTGAEHYAKAELLLSEVGREQKPNFEGTVHPVYHDGLRAEMIAQAQVHATLALAAATAYPAVKDYLGDEAHEMRDWTYATERKQARS